MRVYRARSSGEMVMLADVGAGELEFPSRLLAGDGAETDPAFDGGVGCFDMPGILLMPLK